MVPKFEMSTYFYSNVIWLQSGPKISTLAGSSKTARRIFIFLIAMGAEYLSYVKSIATFALTFNGYIILVLAIVVHSLLNLIHKDI